MDRIRVRKIVKICIAIVITCLVGTVLYGIYITGGYVRFPDVFYAVGCSALSFNGKYFTKVAITFDSSLFRIGNERLSGVAVVYVWSPYDLYVKTYRLDGPMTICLDLSKAVNDLERYVSASHGNITDYSLFTIWVTLYMYDEHGHLYIGTFSYSPYDYLVERGYSPQTAVVEALKNPLVMFRQPLWLVITRSKVHYTNMTTQFNYAMNVITEEIYNQTVMQRLETQPILKIENDPVLKYIMKRFEKVGCKPAFVKVYWTQLYDARNNVPEGWIKHIRYLTDYEKKFSWKLFATYFSLAYYFPVSKYSANQAIGCVESIVPGVVMPISNMIGWLLYGQPLPTTIWKDTIKPGTKINIKIPIGVEMYFQTYAPIDAELSIGEAKAAGCEAGITFLGKILLGQEIASLELNITGNSAGYYDVHTVYLVVPTKLEYVHDGVAVAYYVTIDYVNGKLYWVVIPLATLVPIYKVDTIEFNRSSWIYTTPTKLLSKLVDWGYTKYKLVFKEVVTKGTPAHKILYKESNIETWMNTCNLGYWISGFIVSIAKLVIGQIVSSLTGPVGSLFYSIASAFFSYAYVNTKNTIVSISFHVRTGRKPITKSFILEIYKLVPKGQTTIVINGHKYLPVMMQYIVIAKPYKTNKAKIASRKTIK